MVRIPSLSRGNETVRDENRDGRIDARDERPGPDRSRDTADRDTPADTRTDGDTRTRDADGRTGTVDRGRDGTAGLPPGRARGAVVERDRGAPPAPPADTDTDRRPDRDGSTTDARRRPEIVAPAGPRPRASILATLSLIVGVAAAGFVLTGTLAGYGIGLGALALLLAIGGVSATARRHIAGRSDALIGLVLGLGAIVAGVLAMTGELSWPRTDGDTVQRFREWLDSQFVNRF